MSVEYECNSKVCEEVGDIPKELSMQPLPCIAFVGLNLSNKNHVQIWNGFACNRQSDRIALYFKALTPKNTIIACKPKKSSYEWHIPKGILKSDWLHKHLFLVPSVALLFVDLDWSELNWEAASSECASKVEQLKRQLTGRNTRIALVLVQENLNFPGDDSLTTERAAHLCSVCDLSPKSLFVLPLSDPQHFIGYVLRIETAIFEMAKGYYQHETKLIKSHKEQLNKTTHQLLFVRHMFKIAFLNEIKQEIQTAIKGYKQAYAYLMEVRVSFTNLLEIKTIAGFINYKICKLSFLQNEPMDAFSQFRKHIDIFKSKSEPKELEFEHAMWLSKQFYILAELFEQAITAGLVPSQTQHPGYYYHEAALQAINRKKICQKIRNEILSDDEYSAIIKKFLPQEFFGQRQWRPGCQSLEPLDIELEKEGIRALQYKEIKFVNHSAIIISILTNSITQFKKHKCPRMMRHIMALVAQEYYSNKDYKNSLMFLNQILPFYRIEKWEPILTSLLRISLSAAYLSANSADFVKFGLEFISSYNSAPEEEKNVIQSSIENVIVGNIPHPMNVSGGDQFNVVADLWERELENREQQSLTINMNAVVPFIEVKPVFASNIVSIDDRVKLSIYAKTNCPKPLQFSKLKVIFTHQFYSDFCVLTNEQDEKKLFFMPGETHLIDFVFDVHPSDVGKSIQVAGVCFYYGTPPFVLLLSWSISDDFSHRCEKSVWQALKQKQNMFAQITTTPFINVVNRRANVSFRIERSLPALIDEPCPFHISVQNNEDKSIHRLRAVIERVSGGPSILLESITCDGQRKCLSDEIHIADNLEVNETSEKLICLLYSSPGSENLRFTIKYELESETVVDEKQFQAVCSQFEDIDVEIVYPFTCFFTTFNIRRNALNYIRVLEPFIVKVNLKPLSCHSIFVESIVYLPNYFAAVMNVPNVKGAFESLSGTVLNSEGNSEIEYIIYCTQEVLSSLSLGNLVIRWRRNTAQSSVTETKILLPEVIVEKCLLYVECSLPQYGVTRQHFQFMCTIYNRTNEMLPLELSMENSDNFMYSGNKQIKLEIPAQQYLKQYYIFYPLVCGYVSLPKLRLVAYPDTNRAMPMDQFLEGLLPTSIQILPQEKVLSIEFEKIVVV